MKIRILSILTVFMFLPSVSFGQELIVVKKQKVPQATKIVKCTDGTIFLVSKDQNPCQTKKH